MTESLNEEEMAEESNSKTRLVLEICTISSAFSSCNHRRRSIENPAFVDWYWILRIDEDAGMDVIRRRYRQLALQLHPDKNDHPKAEFAFKLVSEAYACLSDKARREAFDTKRQSSFCKECHRTPNCCPRKNYKRREQMKPQRMLQAMREVQNRIREENEVIERCLRANKVSGEESPLFDPSDRLAFPGYPHRRPWVFQKPQDCWRSHGDGSRCESPIYQIRTECMSTSRNSTPEFRF